MNNTEHLTASALQRYRERTSPPAELLAVQTHILDCAKCRAELEQTVDAHAAFLSLQRQMTGNDFSLEDEPLHLPYEQLALYVDDKLDEVEREIADSHLAICEECAGDLSDLRRYQTLAAETTPVSAQAFESEAILSSTASPARSGASAEKTAPSWWQRLFAFDFFPSGGALVPAGMAAIVVTILLLGIWYATRTVTKDEVVKVEPANLNIPATPTPTPSPAEQKQPNNTVAPAANQNLSNEENDSTPSPQPAPVLALNDGGERLTFDREGNFTGLESEPDAVRDAVKRTIQAQRAQTPRSLDAITEGQTGVLMSNSAGAASSGVPFALVAPIGKVVHESQPTLRWQPLAGAKSYQVAVVDTKFRVVAQSPVLTETSWTLDQSLPRGANYSWQVAALKEDGTEVVSPVSPAPQAKFRVMEQRAFDEVTRMESSGIKSHLARGVVYAEAGLLDEARAEFAALVRDNPRSQLARKLLKSVQK